MFATLFGKFFCCTFCANLGGGFGVRYLASDPVLDLPAVVAEIGDFDNFDSPDKIMAFAGLSPSTYQSGHLNNCYAHMEKRGSKYLRYALFNATKHVCGWCPEFDIYLQKK